jgi:hypothetical protein
MSQGNKLSRRERDINDVLKAIAAESPRAAVIVLGAELDLALQDALEVFFLPRSSISTKYGFSLFGPDEAAGSFSARIELAYRSGLIPDWCQAELHLIRRIRNEFAHQPAGFAFTDSPVRELIGQLKFPNEIELSSDDPKEELLFSGTLLLGELHVLYLNLHDANYERIRHCTRTYTVRPAETDQDEAEDDRDDAYQQDGFFTGGFSDIDGFVLRLVQSTADTKILSIVSRGNLTAAVMLSQTKGILRLSFVDAWSTRPDTEAAIRQFFQKRKLGQDCGYAVIDSGGPDAKEYLSFGVPAETQLVAALLKDVLLHVYRLQKTDVLYLKYKEHHGLR